MQTSQINGIYTAGLHVTDQERALRFYVDLLRFAVRLDRPPGNGSRWIELAPATAAVTIALIPASEAAPAGAETGIRLMALDAAAENARPRGLDVAAHEVLRWPGVPPMFAFRDPDTNGLEIVEQGSDPGPQA